MNDANRRPPQAFYRLLQLAGVPNDTTDFRYPPGQYFPMGCYAIHTDKLHDVRAKPDAPEGDGVIEKILLNIPSMLLAKDLKQITKQQADKARQLGDEAHESLGEINAQWLIRGLAIRHVTEGGAIEHYNCSTVEEYVELQAEKYDRGTSTVYGWLQATKVFLELLHTGQYIPSSLQALKKLAQIKDPTARAEAINAVPAEVFKRSEVAGAKQAVGKSGVKPSRASRVNKAVVVSGTEPATAVYDYSRPLEAMELDMEDLCNHDRADYLAGLMEKLGALKERYSQL